jgi:hypothetical protein
MKTQRAERLRRTVEFLPPDTKRAMLDGLERNRIITGANTDRRGGMCPMIAADRNAFESGPMADIFAAVWDSYNGACILNRRDASERDLRTLKTMLETSLANSPEFSSELGQAWLDYHVGGDPAGAGPEIDFGQELTDALQQSAQLDTGSHAAIPPAAATPSERKVELVYEGGPLPRILATPQSPAQPAAPTAGQVEGTDRQRLPSVTLNSTYAPYSVAAKRRAPEVRASVDASIPARTRAAQHAAQTSASAERARARAVIANQAATLRGRDWPRAADAEPQARTAAPRPVTRPKAVEAPRHALLAATPFEVPTIRQAAIPQVRTPAAGSAATANQAAALGARVDRPRATDGSPAETAGRTGWSLLPPYRSFDDHVQPAETPASPQSGPTDVPEVQPPDGDRRPVHM